MSDTKTERLTWELREAVQRGHGQFGAGAGYCLCEALAECAAAAIEAMGLDADKELARIEALRDGGRQADAWEALRDVVLAALRGKEPAVVVVDLEDAEPAEASAEPQGGTP